MSNERIFDGIKAVLVDADDTLWESNVFFLQAAEWLCKTGRRFGFSDKAVVRMLDGWEHRNIPRLGFSYRSFETSYLAALRQIVLSGGGNAALHAGLRQRGLQWVRFLRRHPIVFMHGVDETLPHIARAYQTIIVTKGNYHDQMAKVHRSGLLPLLHGCEVVPRKSPADYQRVLAKYGLKPGEVVMVGNSPASDVNNAKRAGIRTVFVPHPKTWSFEMEPILPELPATVHVPHFAALREVLGLPM